MAIHSSILAWKILWTEEPGRLWSMGSQRVGHNWATNTYLLTYLLYVHTHSYSYTFIVPIFAGNARLVSLIFLTRSLVFPVLLFSSISFHCSLKKPFLSLPVILWISASSWVYLSLSVCLSLLFLS